MGLLCAEQGVGNLKNWTFGNSGTPVRRTRRRKSQQMHFQKLWESCAHEKNVGISNDVLSGILGFLCAEQNRENFKKWTFRNSGTPVRRTKRRTSHKMHFQEFWDSLCAVQDVGNLKNWTFRNSGTPVRRTRRRKSQKMDLEELWDSCAQNKTSEISKSPALGLTVSYACFADTPRRGSPEDGMEDPVRLCRATGAGTLAWPSWPLAGTGW